MRLSTYSFNREDTNCVFCRELDFEEFVGPLEEFLEGTEAPEQIIHCYMNRTST